MEKGIFELTLDGMVVSIEADDLTYKQALEMLKSSFPDRELDIYRGLRKAVRPDSAA